jgi:hypothetical protein
MLLGWLSALSARFGRVLWIAEASEYEAGYERGRADLLDELARDEAAAEARLEALGFARLDAGEVERVKGGAPHVP